MSALLDELRSVLSMFRQHVADSVNSGMLVTLDGHLDQLAAAAENGIQAADDAVKNVLGELYSALHGSAPEAPAAPPASGGRASRRRDPAAISGESGPEALALPTDTDAPKAG